jgi:hypothetical protein
MAHDFTVGVRNVFATGLNPTSVAIDDVNADGKLDLAVANYGSATVSVLLGNGAGGFGTKTDFATASGPRSVTIGDVNDDGRPDLVTANQGSNTVSVLLGNGAGGFGAKTDFATGSGPTSVATGDVNDDGRPDLVVANSDAATVSVLLGNGAGGFGTKTDFATGAHPSSVAIGDVSGDGKPDLMVADPESNAVSVLLGDGAGGFGAKNDFAVGAGPQSVAIGDVNNDGKLDLAAANSVAGTVSVLLGDGAGGFGTRNDYTTGVDPHAVAIGDVSSDGKADLAVANSTAGTVSVFLGDGAGGFGARADFAGGSVLESVAIGDVNGDGNPDLAVVNYGAAKISMLLGNGAGGFRTRTDFATPPHSRSLSVAVGDLNHDGRQDVAAACRHRDPSEPMPPVSVFLSDDADGLGTRTDYLGVGFFGHSFRAGRSVANGDLNHDGKLDLVVGCMEDASGFLPGVAVLLGNGGGGFGPETFSRTVGLPYSIAVGDVNGDLNPDLAASLFDENMVAVALGDGMGGFGAWEGFGAGESPSSVAMGDLNGDGNPDLALASSNEPTVSVLLGDGAGGFGTMISYPTANHPHAAAIGDLNGDGKPDLAVACFASAVSVLWNDGVGGFGTRTDITVWSPGSIKIVDLNGDGKPDLVTAGDTANHNVAVLLGDGTGGFGTVTYYAAGSDGYSLDVGDVNGDGKLDVVTAGGHASETVSRLLAFTPTRTVLAVDPKPTLLGSPITLTAAVSVAGPGTDFPTGLVSFFDGTTLLGSAPVSGGVAGLALYAPYLGDRSITAVYQGDGKLSGSISAAQPLRVTATASPTIQGIADVAGDQGGQVLLRFAASALDRHGSGIDIVRYDVFRRIDSSLPLRQRAGRPSSDPPSVKSGEPERVMVDGWDFVGSLPASEEAAYNLAVPTLADSNFAGCHRAVFFVSAATVVPSVHYDSPPDSGSSLDNLPPAPPAHFAGTYQNGASILHWSPNPETDLWYYRLYRGSTEDFVPGPENLIATVSDTSYVDPGLPGNYYRLSAVDVNYNEGGNAAIGPVTPSGIPEGGTLILSLEGIRPNPSIGKQLRVVFSLPDTAPARLELVDVSGRLLVQREVGSLGGGRHTVDLTAGEHMAPGLYLVRLTQGANVRVVRVTLL